MDSYRPEQKFSKSSSCCLIVPRRGPRLQPHPNSSVCDPLKSYRYVSLHGFSSLVSDPNVHGALRPSLCWVFVSGAEFLPKFTGSFRWCPIQQFTELSVRQCGGVRLTGAEQSIPIHRVLICSFECVIWGKN